MMEMVKRERLGEDESNSNSNSKGQGQGQGSVDISRVVPEELLGVILSLLTMKEAAATSLLGRSWRYLWTFTPNLDLSACSREKLFRSGNWDDRVPILLDERRNYIRWVDRVLALHKPPNLDTFLVLFDLDAADSQHIDRWLHYALSTKTTQRLELNLIDYTAIRTNQNPQLCYTFPYKQGAHLPPNFKLLKQLYLYKVNVTGGSVNFFLANCPLLELVSLSASQRLSSLQIIRPCPSFRCLEIWACHNLNNVVIRHSNLVNIKYSGKRIHFELINVPLLTQLWIGGLLTERFTDVADMFFSVFPQLEMFKIIFFLSGPSHHEECEQFAAAVEMSRLKQLVVNYYLCCDAENLDYVPPITHLLSASPYLQKFVVEGVYRGDSGESTNGACANISRKILKMIPRAYSLHLKEVEFVGYDGGIGTGNRRYDELIMHFVDNNVALRNMVIDPRCLTNHPEHRPWELSYLHKMEDDMFSRAYAKDRFQKLVPSKINLKIL